MAPVDATRPQDRLRNLLALPGELVPLSVVRRARALPGRGVLLRLVNDRLRRHPRAFGEVETEAGRIVGGNTSDIIERYLYVFGTWEPSLTAYVRSRLRPGDVFVDIGANVGYFTLLAARLVGPDGHVVAIEPLPRTVERLRSNVAANQLANVSVVPLVASDRDGDVEIYQGPATNLGRSGTMPMADGAAVGRVGARTAASLVPEELWPRVRVVKIDVEGDEHAVIAGLSPLLRRLPEGASVVTEVAPDRLRDRGADAASLFERMAVLGFTAASLENDYHPRGYTRRTAHAPVPLEGPPAGMTDVVFTKG